jgi:hypothetical protein
VSVRVKPPNFFGLVVKVEHTYKTWAEITADIISQWPESKRSGLLLISVSAVRRAATALLQNISAWTLLMLLLLPDDRVEQEIQMATPLTTHEDRQCCKEASL